MYCGIVLDGRGKQCHVAFLDSGEVEIVSSGSNEKIVEMVSERAPDVTVLNAPSERSNVQGFREGDEELIEEGHAMLPQGMRDNEVLERAAHLSRSLEASGAATRIIESDPRLVSEVLGLDGDAGLEEMGVETREIRNVKQYDAVVLAVLGKLYSDNRCEDHGIVVPEEDVASI